MDARELRIGNWVSTIAEESEFLKITGIRDYDFDSDIGMVRLDTLDGWNEVDSVAPIPLSEDILLKAGFELVVTGYQDVDYLVFKESGIKEKECIWIHCHNGYCTIFISEHQFLFIANYVHELQNFMFCIRKTELPLEL